MAERFVGIGQTYSTIRDALFASNSGDTVTITDSATYLESWYDLRKDGITLRFTGNSPDNYPVLKINMNANTLDAMINWSYKNLCFEQNVSSFTQNMRKVTFYCCIFRNYNKVFDCDSQNFPKELNSCIFYNVSDYVVNAAWNYSNSSFVFRNCTFHNCANIFKNDFGAIDYAWYPKITNCLFTNCLNIASSVSDSSPSDKRSILYSQFNYCTFSNNPQTVNARFNATCKVNVPVTDVYVSVSKSLPSDFIISNNSNVYNAGSTYLGYQFDISGRRRNDPFDIGAWEVTGIPKLSAPLGVIASDGEYSNHIRISWQPVSDAVNYDVYRCTEQNGEFIKINSSDLNVTFFDDYSASVSTIYWYRVRAKAPGFIDSDLSDADQGFIWQSLQAPLNVNASDGTYSNRIEITWDSVGNATSYEIFRSNDINGIYISLSVVSDTVYKDTVVEPGIEYWYKLKAKAPGFIDSALSIPDQGYMRLISGKFMQEINPYL